MLQTNRTDHSVNPENMPPEFSLPTETLAAGAAFIRRRLSVIALTCLITFGVGLLYLITAAPTFTADADVVVNSKATSGDAASVSTIVESQIAIIKSKSIARAVIEKLGLAEDPEFARRNGVVRGVARSISRLLGWSKPETESSAVQYALESFGRKLAVKRTGLTYIVNITFDSIDPERAAQILNTVLETYIAAQMDSKYKSDLRSEKWVKDRLNELSSRASDAKKALANYLKNRSDVADSAEPGDAGTPPLQSTARTQVEVRELEVAVESSARTYDNFLRVLRYMEAQQQSSPALEAHLLTEASPPMRAGSPKIGIVLGISTAGGVFLGLVIGMLRDLSDRGIQTRGQVLKELQIACIAVVPEVKSAGAKFGALFTDALFAVWTSGPQRALSDTRSRRIVRTESPIWTITDVPQSRFTESFLEIKIAIDSMNRSGRRNQVIGITSAHHGEGKSTVAAALALLMARTGSKAILVDCNLRNRSLSAALAPSAELGVLEVISGAASVRETTWIDSITQLAFLPVGNKSRPSYAGEVLASEIADQLFETLRETYDYIIVDLPAVAPFADVQAAVCALDSFIFVIEASCTNIDVVKRGIDVVRHENVIGIVLNKAKGDGV
jgi:capsular exopolysaccharide synthesis family protein